MTNQILQSIKTEKEVCPQVFLNYTDENGADKKITCTYKVASGKLQTDLIALGQEYFELSKKLDEKYKELGLPNDMTAAENQSVESIMLSQKKIGDIYLLATCHTINQFKLLCSMKQLSTEEQVVFNQESDSEFWQSQDLSILSEVIQFFRRTIQF